MSKVQGLPIDNDESKSLQKSKSGKSMLVILGSGERHVGLCSDAIEAIEVS